MENLLIAVTPFIERPILTKHANTMIDEFFNANDNPKLVSWLMKYAFLKDHVIGFTDNLKRNLLIIDQKSCFIDQKNYQIHFYFNFKNVLFNEMVTTSLVMSIFFY